MSLEETINSIKQTELSNFCLKECKKPCCSFSPRVMYLPMSEEEASLIYQNEVKKSPLFKIAESLGIADYTFKFLFQLEMRSRQNCGELVINKKNKTYTMINTTCPRYDPKSRKCNIHDCTRPEDCTAFPIYLSQEKSLSLENPNILRISLKSTVMLDTRCDYIKHNWKNLAQKIYENNSEELSKFQPPFTVFFNSHNKTTRHPYRPKIAIPKVVQT